MLGKSTDEKEMGKDDGHWSYSVWHSGRGEAMMAGGRQGSAGIRSTLPGVPCYNPSPFFYFDSPCQRLPLDHCLFHALHRQSGKDHGAPGSIREHLVPFLFITQS